MMQRVISIPVRTWLLYSCENNEINHRKQRTAGKRAQTVNLEHGITLEFTTNKHVNVLGKRM